jgi:Ca2+-binding RTX toxin-like protein
MPTVTVAGAHGTTVTLTFDTSANVSLAERLAAAITSGVQAGSILPAVDTDGPPPPLPAGKTGEFVQTKDGVTMLPSGYTAFVNTASDAVVFGSGDAGESVLSSIGDLTFFATGGSGSVVAGGGENRILVPSTDPGNWSINTGNGDDSVLALGSGNDTINAGAGHNAIMLGSGRDVVQSAGDDTVNAGSGRETITAIGKHHDLIYGNASQLLFVGSAGSATVFGGTGSDTFFGGKGPDLVYGGTGGNNLLFAGTGKATLFGGGDGDQLFAAGNQAQGLHAGVGNETLFGGFASGADTFYGGTGADQITGGLGSDTFVAGTGSATVTAGLSSNLFVFTNGQAGGTELIQSFTSGRDQIDLQGYRKNEVAKALKSQQVVGGSDTITLSDNTKITFAGISSLTASDFITSGGTSADVPGGDDGKHGHGKLVAEDHDNIRATLFGHS